LSNQKTYSEKIQKIGDRLEKTLREFVKTQSPESLHDFRTSARRLQAAYVILPKKLRRNKKVRSYVESRQKLFKSSSEARDMDIILSRLTKHKTQALFLISKLERARIKKAQRLAKKAKTAEVVRDPNMDRIDPSKMTKRIRKISRRLNSKLSEQASLIVSDSAKTKEIHAFRKTSKRLRYVLEFANTALNVKEIARLRVYQDLLGEMRDAQLTHAVLAQSNLNGRFSELIESEKKLIDAAYLAFVQSWRKANPEKPKQEENITVNAI
jgi:CHAD domain-containing protein